VLVLLKTNAVIDKFTDGLCTERQYNGSLPLLWWV